MQPYLIKQWVIWIYLELIVKCFNNSVIVNNGNKSMAEIRKWGIDGYYMPDNSWF